jgi:hypothetical protein
MPFHSLSPDPFSKINGLENKLLETMDQTHSIPFSSSEKDEKKLLYLSLKQSKSMLCVTSTLISLAESLKNQTIAPIETYKESQKALHEFKEKLIEIFETFCTDENIPNRITDPFTDFNLPEGEKVESIPQHATFSSSHKSNSYTTAKKLLEETKELSSSIHKESSILTDSDVLKIIDRLKQLGQTIDHLHEEITTEIIEDLIISIKSGAAGINNSLSKDLAIESILENIRQQENKTAEVFSIEKETNENKDKKNFWLVLQDLWLQLYSSNSKETPCTHASTIIPLEEKTSRETIAQNIVDKISSTNAMISIHHAQKELASIAKLQAKIYENRTQLELWIINNTTESNKTGSLENQNFFLKTNQTLIHLLEATENSLFQLLKNEDQRQIEVDAIHAQMQIEGLSKNIEIKMLSENEAHEEDLRAYLNTSFNLDESHLEGDFLSLFSMLKNSIMKTNELIESASKVYARAINQSQESEKGSSKIENMSTSILAQVALLFQALQKLAKSNKATP